MDGLVAWFSNGDGGFVEDGFVAMVTKFADG
jgi:hypothetical protein